MLRSVWCIVSSKFHKHIIQTFATDREITEEYSYTSPLSIARILIHVCEKEDININTLMKAETEGETVTYACLSIYCQLVSWFTPTFKFTWFIQAYLTASTISNFTFIFVRKGDEGFNVNNMINILPKQNTNVLHSCVKRLPVHVFLSIPSLYPTLQLHLYLPSWFLHIWLHPPFLLLHSLISKRTKYIEIEREICFF